jgi:hypothetical protein
MEHHLHQLIFPVIVCGVVHVELQQHFILQASDTTAADNSGKQQAT